MTLSNIKQMLGKTLRNYLMRFNEAAATVDKRDLSIILMAAVFGVASKTDFKIALEMNSSMDLMEFYHEAERYLRQENAEVDNANINVVDDGGLSGVGYGKEKGKRKADNDFEGPKRRRRESKFPSYIDLTETPKRIYILESISPTESQLREDPPIVREGLESCASSMNWKDMKQTSTDTFVI